jgi:hypothetical protein
MMDELLQRGEALAMFTQGNAGQRRVSACCPWNLHTVRSSFNNFKGGEREMAAGPSINSSPLKILETARLVKFFDHTTSLLHADGQLGAAILRTFEEHHGRRRELYPALSP